MAFPSVDPSSFQMPDVMSSHLTMPQPQTGGMFGNPYAGSDWWRQGAADALTAFGASLMARSSPQVAQQMMAGVQQQRMMNRQAQLSMLQSNLEFNRQMQMAQLGAQLKMQYPDSPLAQALYAQGLRPGDPQFQSAMATEAKNLQDPVVNAGLYGPVLRSQVAGAANAKPQPTAAAIAALKANPNLAADYDAQFGPGASAQVLGNGGQTAPAQSGGFSGNY